jgi:hypothetical protein
MPEQFTETVEVLNRSSAVTITLDANTASVRAGGNGTFGDLEFRNDDGEVRVVINANGLLRIYNSAGNIAAEVAASTSTLSLGTSGLNSHIRLTGTTGNISAGDHGQNGDLELLDTAGEPRVRINASTGNIWLGGNGADGDLVIFPNDGDNSTVAESTIHLDGDTSAIVFRAGGDQRARIDGAAGNVWLGGNGTDGDLVLFANAGDNATVGASVIHLDGGGGVLSMRADGQTTARLTTGGNLWLGGNGHAGDLVMFGSGGDNTSLAGARVHVDAANAVLRLGSNGANGDVLVFPNEATSLTDDDSATIHLRGSDGDIILRNADCAEDFDVAEMASIGPGTVVALDANGAVRESRDAYERAVAGVVSGAGDLKPGIRLDRRDTGRTRLPVALVGKVFCKADATFGAIQAGDLLTSSPTPGHAMKASDPARAFGAVIGKALTPLASGRDLIPILVALQ